jgi:hypothetical protein
MALLELVSPRPDWLRALEVAFTRPPGVPERRANEDPWDASPAGKKRPRRISDELAWLRQAMDEPESHGLKPLEGSAAVGLWDADGDGQAVERLCRLRDRRVLDAAGFLLHDGEDPAEFESEMRA